MTDGGYTMTEAWNLQLQAKIATQDKVITELVGCVEEAERVMAFIYEDDALPHDQAMGLCIDPYGTLAGWREVLARARGRDK